MILVLQTPAFVDVAQGQVVHLGSSVDHIAGLAFAREVLGSL